MFRVVKVIDKESREWLTPDGEWSATFTEAKVYTDFDEARDKAKEVDGNVWSPPRPKVKK